jgi:hypothetical protein
MYKVAIQLAGQLRNWDKADPHFREFKKYALTRGVDLKFFIATWNRSGVKLDYSNEGPLVDIDTSFFERFTIDEQFNKGPAFLIGDRWSEVTRLRNQYEKDTKEVFDAVILTRPDIVFDLIFFNEIEIKLSNINRKKSNFSPGCVYSAYGSLSINRKRNIKNPDGYFDSSDIDFGHMSDDRLIIGHPVAMNTFVNILNEVRLHSITPMAHSMVADHCTLNKVLNLPFYGRESGFGLNRDTDYPSFFKQEVIIENKKYEPILSPHDKKRLEEVQKKRKRSLI